MLLTLRSKTEENEVFLRKERGFGWPLQSYLSYYNDLWDCVQGIAQGALPTCFRFPHVHGRLS